MKRAFVLLMVVMLVAGLAFSQAYRGKKNLSLPKVKSCPVSIEIGSQMTPISTEAADKTVRQRTNPGKPYLLKDEILCIGRAHGARHLLTNRSIRHQTQQQHLLDAAQE